MPEQDSSQSTAVAKDKEQGTDTDIAISAETVTQSKPFIGQWNELVSTTNWDKGEIIFKWRESLKDQKASASESTDEAWSQLVGGVTPQHVGRLRRTYERFGHTYKEYEGVYWSHFYAALDWDDAEMWLEGAVQSKWSVSAMRQQRWETLGKVGQAPDAADIVASEAAEETQSLALSENPRNNDRDYIEGPVHEGPDWGDEDSPAGKSSSERGGAEGEDSEDQPAPKPHAIRPFESFSELPDDVEQAANAFKVAIISHKAQEWEEISKEDVIGLLDALKQLVELAPV